MLAPFARNLAAPLIRPVRLLTARLRGRDDREHEMSFNRLVFAAIITGSLCFSTSDEAQYALKLMGAYFLLAFAVLIHILVYPAVSKGRRLCALLLDTVFLSWQLHLGGESGAAFFPIYLWVTFGNGFRFGINWLRIALLVTSVSFVFVVLSTPFWKEQGHLSAGLLASLIVLPAYAGTLISRLSKALQQAEQASEAKTLFLASVSHELRTPLTAIIGMGGMLRSTRLDTDQKEMAETIHDAATSLLSLISGILDFAQIEAGRMRVETEIFDLPGLLREIRGLVAAQARIKNLKVVLHMDARTPVQITASRRDLNDILVNLAANAVKFTERGTVVIAVDGAPAGNELGQLTIRVIDSGIGISTGSQRIIFESFTQADATIRDRYGGTGLGLAISRRKAELLGGSLQVSSVEGDGAEFTLNVGVGVPDQPVGPGDAALTAIVSGPRSARRDRITAQLTQNGTPVLTAREALELLTTGGVGADLICRSFVMLLFEGSHPSEVGPPDDALALHARVQALPCVIIRAEEQTDFRHLDWPLSATLLCSENAQDVRAAMFAARTQVLGNVVSFPEYQLTRRVPSRHVLIADDNAVSRRVLVMMLEAAGHTVTAFADGEAALDALEYQEERFDIVLMDVNMPIMNGLEATKLYRFMALGQPHLPIVGLTADATPEAAERCLEAGMDLCVTKPISPAALANLVEQLTPDHPDDVKLAEPARQAPRGGHTTEEATLDSDTLDMLERLGGDDFLSGLVRDFLAEAQETGEAITKAARQADLLEFRSAVHALHSSACNVGAKSLAELCHAWQGFRSAEFADQAPLVPGILRAEMARTREALLAARASLID